MTRFLHLAIVMAAAASMVACAKSTPNDIAHPTKPANTQPTQADAQPGGSPAAPAVTIPTPTKPTPPPPATAASTATNASGTNASGTAGASASGTAGTTTPAPQQKSQTAGSTATPASSQAKSPAPKAAAAVSSANNAQDLAQLNGIFALSKMVINVTDSSVPTADTWTQVLKVPGYFSLGDVITQSLQPKPDKTWQVPVNINLVQTLAVRNGEIELPERVTFVSSLNSLGQNAWDIVQKPDYSSITFATDKVLETKPVAPGDYQLNYLNQIPLEVKETYDASTKSVTLTGTRIYEGVILNFQLIYQPAASDGTSDRQGSTSASSGQGT